MRRKDHLDRIINACNEIIDNAGELKFRVQNENSHWKMDPDAYLDVRFNGYAPITKQLLDLAKSIDEMRARFEEAESFMAREKDYLDDPIYHKADPTPPDWFVNDMPDSDGSNGYVGAEKVMQENIEHKRRMDQYPYVWLKPPTTTDDGLH